MIPEKLINKHPFRQWRSWQIPGTDLTLLGYSRSNDKVFFYIPQIKFCLDGGLCEGRQGDYVFITHTHDDHVADIAFLASKSSGVDIYAPAVATSFIERYIGCRRELNNLTEVTQHNKRYVLHGVCGGDRFGVRQNFQVEVFDCFHKVACVGYGFSQVRKTLRLEYQVLKDEMLREGRGEEFGRVVAEKRKSGEDVDEEIVQPLFVYLGDTDACVFEQGEKILQYPVLITECTFLKESEREKAKIAGHTLWSDLKPIVMANPQVTFVLTHFSLRYSSKEIAEFFQQEIGLHGIKNLVIWVS